MKDKRISLVVLILFFMVSLPLTAFSHSGRTDGSGGHRDNQNKSGLGYYHYHCGGYPPHLHSGGVCPYKKTSSATTKTSSATTEITPATTPATTISKVYAQSIRITNTTNRIAKGKQLHLEAVITPQNTTDKTVTWSVSDPSVAEINRQGLFSALHSGTVAVTATTSNGLESTIIVTIYSKFPATVIGIGGTTIIGGIVWFLYKKRKNTVTMNKEL